MASFAASSDVDPLAGLRLELLQSRSHCVIYRVIYPGGGFAQPEHEDENQVGGDDPDDETENE